MVGGYEWVHDKVNGCSFYFWNLYPYNFLVNIVEICSMMGSKKTSGISHWFFVSLKKKRGEKNGEKND